jgi:hypothetical protein
LHFATICQKLLDELFATFATSNGNEARLTIPFFTQYERRGIIYRAHPLFRREHAYYDWAFVKWVVGQDPLTGLDEVQPYVGRILGFIQHPDGEMKAIVHSVKETRNRQNLAHGVFCYFWELEQEGPRTDLRPKLHLVSVDTLMEHACMIPYTTKDDSIWFHIWHPRKWENCFSSINNNE